RVVVGVGEEHRSRGDQPGDGGPFPVVGVDHQHAVAMAVDDLVADVAFEVAHAADGNGDLDALVRRGDPDGRRSAAGDAGDADLLRVHVGPRQQIIDGADAVPALDAGGRVAARVPPPAVLDRVLFDRIVLIADAVGAVMNAG